MMRYETVTVKESAGLDPTALSPAKPREKWLRKRTQVKLRVRARWLPGAGARGPGLQGWLAGGRYWLWRSRWRYGLHRCDLSQSAVHDRGACPPSVACCGTCQDRGRGRRRSKGLSGQATQGFVSKSHLCGVLKYE